MGEKEDAMVECAGVQEPDIVVLILQHLTEPRDVLAAAAVCRTWRAAMSEPSQLQSWQFDDELTASAGTKASATPMQPKTPLPKHWVNPTTHSPFSAFKTPRSLVQAPSPIRSLLWPMENRSGESSIGGVSGSEESGPSPRTPSPVQPVVPGGAFLDIVMTKMVIGKYLGDLDISSSRLSDKSLQFDGKKGLKRKRLRGSCSRLCNASYDSLCSPCKTVRLILISCPRLHTLRLQQLCVPAVYPSCSLEVGPSPLRVGVGTEYELLRRVKPCGWCGHLTERGFAAVRWHCPDLCSVTLVLQHMITRGILRQVLTELGALPKLHTLSLELRMPSFGGSLKSQCIWQEHMHFSDKELFALLKAGPPPLNALALNRLDLTESSISALAAACPNLEALELRSAVPGEDGVPPTIGALFKGSTSLSAAALGIFSTVESLLFDTWSLPSLKRLRLETTEPLSLHHLQSLKSACMKLESLHLIWGTHDVVTETHIYPITEDTILEHLNNL